MNRCYRPLTLLALAGVLSLLRPAMLGAAEPGVVIRDAANRVIPIALSGFSDEVRRVLEFDLYVVGFDVKPATPQYQLVGAPGGGPVRATLTDVNNSQTLFARAYPGGSPRAQAHALADDVVKTLLQLPGIASTRIAFKNSPGGRNGQGETISEIWASDYDGANPIALTGDGTIAAAPSWVPGRLELFYVTYRSVRPEIYMQNLRTGDRKRIFSFPGTSMSPAVSPDGTRVAMILSKSGSPDLWVANVDGTGLRQLTTTKELEASPCWSPDGTRICFTSTEGGRPALYTIPAGGGVMTRLRTGGVTQCTEPDWSPDGKWIAFTRASGEFTLYVVPAAGGDARALVAGEDPSWSPNSRTLVFARRSGSERRLSLLDVPTGQVKDLARISGNCSQPSWAR
ncbi:MAG: PD40 domain-containing protein [Verrucomicrobiae bacterium]|nr:PD40 domain-containing protein [Verrucomicrobiae bacterium]